MQTTANLNYLTLSDKNIRFKSYNLDNFLISDNDGVSKIIKFAQDKFFIISFVFNNNSVYVVCGMQLGVFVDNKERDKEESIWSIMEKKFGVTALSGYTTSEIIFENSFDTEQTDHYDPLKIYFTNKLTQNKIDKKWKSDFLINPKSKIIFTLIVNNNKIRYYFVLRISKHNIDFEKDILSNLIDFISVECGYSGQLLQNLKKSNILHLGHNNLGLTSKPIKSINFLDLLNKFSKIIIKKDVPKIIPRLRYTTNILPDNSKKERSIPPSDHDFVRTCLKLYDWKLSSTPNRDSKLLNYHNFEVNTTTSIKLLNKNIRLSIKLYDENRKSRLFKVAEIQLI